MKDKPGQDSRSAGKSRETLRRTAVPSPASLNSLSAFPPAHGATNLIVIGTSAGGHHALRWIIKDLPHDLPAATIIAIHMPADSKFALPHWLAQFGHIPVTVAHEADVLRNGHVYVIPPGRHASIDQGLIHLETTPREKRTVAVDALFESAARDYKARAVGVVLTGRGRDGTAGLQAVHDAGGLAIVQNPKDAEYPDMPANAMKHVPVDFCLNLPDLAPALDLLVRANAQLETGLNASLRFLKHRVALLVRLLEQSKENAEVQGLLGAELQSLREEVRSLRRILPY